MPLSAFAVQNYRSFLDRTRIELRPVTLLFGHNNVGKSALMRALPLISASVAGKNGPIDNSSPVLRGGKFADLVSRCGSSPTVEFELAWDDTKGRVARLLLVLREIPSLHGRPVVLVEKLQASDARGSVILELGWVAEKDPEPGVRQMYSLRTGAKSFRGLVQFAGFLPIDDGTLADALPSRGQGTKVLTLIQEVRNRLLSISSSVSWLGSIRVPPQRDEVESIDPPHKLGPDGREALQVLAYDRRTGGKLLEEVSAWYERLFGWRIDVEVISGTDRVRTMLSPLGDPKVRINLADTGEGMSQVLPVLLTCAQARRALPGVRPIVAIEQPELHLHADAQVGLAGHLCSIASAENAPVLLIETHSENFLLGVQLALLNRQLSAASVRIYWVSQSERGLSIVEPVQIDELGRLSGLPPGVFMEAIEQSRHIYRLRQQRQNIQGR